MARKPKLGLPLQTLRNAPDALEGRRLRGGVFEIEPDHVETVAGWMTVFKSRLRG